MVVGKRQADLSGGHVDAAFGRPRSEYKSIEGAPSMLRHSANLLTGLRLLLAVPIMLLVLMDSRTSLLIAASLFAVAALTDLLDGHVARRWHTVSALGSFLDPIADKFAIDGCVVALLLHAAFPLPLAVLLIGRDVAVTAMRIGHEDGGRRLLPSGLAKAKTFTLYAGVFGLLLSRAGEGAVFRGSMLLVILATLLSLVSGADYLTRLNWRPGLSASFLAYLLFPRPGPLLSCGKIAFFLIGSFVAISAGFPAATIWKWLAVFAIYELVLSQGKYLINDLTGRDSDGHFLRGARNQCPKNGRGVCLIAAYAAARSGAGVAALLVVAGWAVAAVGALTLLLQLLYELLKLVDIPSRGEWLFLVAGANYGLRALVGAAAVNQAAPASAVGLFVFLWGSGLGALFLASYWRQQGQYYIEQQHISPSLLARYKPGILSVYRRDSRAERSGRPLLHDRLLTVVGMGGILFVAFVPGVGSGLRGATMFWYLCLAPLGLCGFWLARGAGARRLAFTAVPALLTGLIAAALGFHLGTASMIPFVLGSIALLTHVLLNSGVARSQVLHGAIEINPRAS